MYPELVDEFRKQAMEDEYQEEPSSLARFDDTDDEEKEENADMLVPDEYARKDMPKIEWDRNNPRLTPGTAFELMMDYRNALTTYYILTQNDIVIDKSEPRRLTVHCPDERCRWRLHAFVCVQVNIFIYIILQATLVSIMFDPFYLIHLFH